MSARKRTLNITWREAWPIWVTFGILFGFGALGVWVVLPASQIPTKALLHGEDVTVHLGELQPNLPHLFAYPLEPGHTTEFFVERGAGDRVTVAFASCRRCYRSGHYRRGTHILCGGCNQPMEQVRPGQAPSPQEDCTQIPIPYEETANQIVVRGEAIRETFLRWYSPVLSNAGTPKHTNYDSR